jgi:hypothetical protein
MDNKKQTKKELFEDWIERNVKILTNMYGIGETTIIVNSDNRPGHSKRDNGTVVFTITYSTVYRTANLYYYPCALEFFEKKKFKMLTQALTHEIAHILTCRLADIAEHRYTSAREVDEAVEELTETIGQIARKLLEAKNIKMV